MSLTQREARALDAWITREPDEEAMWCVEEDCNADDCTEPDEHAASWITLAEKRRDEVEDYAFDLWHDEH